MTIRRRDETRVERYVKKLNSAKFLPATLVSVNFHCDENLAFLIRTAACFGVKNVHVIGSIPPRNYLRNASGSTVDFVSLYSHRTPSEFLQFARTENLKLIAAELTDDAENIYEHQFDFSVHTALIMGNETSGVPTEILNNAETLYIPMTGVAFCLNTSQTATVFISEFYRQYNLRG